MTLSKFIRLFNPVVLMAIIAFLIPLIIIEYYVLQHTNGTFSYALDDTFIHMAIAKNIAFKGVWSTSPFGFASASSSVLYPLILAGAFEIMGLQNAVPFIINVLVAIAFLIALQRWLNKQAISKAGQLFILLAVIFLTPLPVLVISGMEHTLQLLFCFLFLAHYSDALGKLTSQEVSLKAKDWELPKKVYLYGALMVASRYECTTLIGITGLILLLHRKYWLAFQLVLICLLPIIVFGIYSLFKGSYFIPNSVLLKSETPPLTFEGLYNFFTKGLWRKLADTNVGVMGYNTIAAQRLLFILPISFMLFWKQIRQVRSYYYFLIMLMAAVSLHLAFAATAKFPRFEAYLVGCTTVIIGVLLAKYARPAWQGMTGILRWVVAGTSILLVFPLFLRGIISFSDVSPACINIYEQQYQMGRFVRAHYYKYPVAVNDLGAVSFLSEGPKLDLIGLGTVEVARSRKNGYWNADFLQYISHENRVPIAIIYDFWFPQALLQHWNKVASWQIPDNVMCAGDRVSFYAVDTTGIKDLKNNLVDFQKLLPPDVQVQYY